MLRPALLVLLATLISTLTYAAEIPDEVQRMLDDLGGPAVQLQNNGKLKSCALGGTKRVTVSEIGNASIFTADYLNCREPGSTRDGYYQLMLQNGEIIGKKSKRSINGELFDAVRDNQLKKVRNLVKNKADVNYSESVSQGEQAYIDEWTPLMWASVNGNTEIVKLLLKNGAWVNYLNSAVVSALWLAADNGHLAAVKELVKHGAHINNRNAENVTPLMAAAMHGHYAVVKYLIKAKADINLVHNNNDGDSALMLAIARKQNKVAQLLINSGANINISNKFGITALMIATAEGDEEIVVKLLAKNADISMKTESGLSALDIAVGKGYTRIAERLKKAKSIQMEYKSIK